MSNPTPPDVVSEVSEAPEALPGEPVAPASEPPTVQRKVIRNTLFLTLGQVVGIPLSMAYSAITARYLGAEMLGLLYMGTTFNSLGNLAVDWGQSGALPQLVAREPARAGEFLGSSLAWRTVTSCLVLGVLSLSCKLLGYPTDFLVVLALVAVGYFFSTIGGACERAVMGFERTDVSAYRQMIEQLSTVVIALPILLLGGKLHALLVGSATAVFIGLVYAWRALRLVDIRRLLATKAALRELLAVGTPFAFTGLVMVLQPYVDAVVLSKLSNPGVVGYYAVARKLIGVLVLPASALIGALYPTLCRLHATSMPDFIAASNGSIRGTSLLALPVALGCFLYPDVGVAIYSKAAFGPAEDDLRMMALFLFLVYFTMPIGTAILASGRQRAWAIVQSLCVGVSLLCDPPLVAYFQRRSGNGGVGVCAAAVLSEIIVVACGLWMVPRGTFDRRTFRVLLSAGVAGALMAATAHLLRPVNSFVGAPVAVIVYGATVWLTGGIDQSFLVAVRRTIGKKVSRLRPSA